MLLLNKKSLLCRDEGFSRYHPASRHMVGQLGSVNGLRRLRLKVITAATLHKEEQVSRV